MSEMHNSASDRRAACEADANVGGALRTAFSHSRLKGGRMGSGHTSEPLTIQFVLGAIRRWWMVALPCGVLLAAVGAGIVHWVYQPAHQATAWLRVSVNTPYIAFPMREDTRQFLETQLELMRSPLVLGPVISQPEIAQVPEIRDREAPIVWLGTKIKAASVGQSELVQVSFEARNPADAARVVNAIVDTYLDFRGRDNSEQVQRVVELLEEEKARRMHEVDLMRDTIRELAKQATGKDPFAPKSRNDTAAIHPLADLQARLVNAEVERQILEARVKAFGESLAKPAEVSEAKLDQAVEQHPNVQALRAELLEKKSRLQDYERTLVQGVKIPVTCGWTSKFAATNRAYKRPARDCATPSARTLRKS